MTEPRWYCARCLRAMGAEPWIAGRIAPVRCAACRRWCAPEDVARIVGDELPDPKEGPDETPAR